MIFFFLVIFLYFLSLCTITETVAVSFKAAWADFKIAWADFTVASLCYLNRSY